MIVWLDHLIFGSGHGIKSPYWNDVYFWQNGEFYLWSGWFGAQLISFQWRHPKPQERRIIEGREMRVYHSERRWGRVCISWSLCGKDSIEGLDINEANSKLTKFKSQLSNPYGNKKWRIGIGG